MSFQRDTGAEPGNGLMRAGLCPTGHRASPLTVQEAPAMRGGLGSSINPQLQEREDVSGLTRVGPVHDESERQHAL